MPKKLLLFPFGGNGREASGLFRDPGLGQEWEVLGFVDDDPGCLGRQAGGIKVLGGREIFKKFPDAQVLAVPGNPQNFLERKAIIDSLELEGSRWARIIHPSVFVSSDVKIGHNVLLMPHVVLGCGVSVGNHCVILPHTVVGHDTVLGDYCCVGSNVSVGGFVTIGANCYVGSGSSLRDHITVEEKSLVGLGSNVVCDVEKEAVVAGNPAKRMERAR
jgi:sugar O-acyltransferase (sialic acid O-acetyltransferase NeuD family)